MNQRIQSIMRKFYHIVSANEIKRRKFHSPKRLAWFCMQKSNEDLDVTWDEAEEAAALIMDELDLD